MISHLFPIRIPWVHFIKQQYARRRQAMKDKWCVDMKCGFPIFFTTWVRRGSGSELKQGGNSWTPFYYFFISVLWVFFAWRTWIWQIVCYDRKLLPSSSLLEYAGVAEVNWYKGWAIHKLLPWTCFYNDSSTSSLLRGGRSELKMGGNS